MQTFGWGLQSLRGSQVKNGISSGGTNAEQDGSVPVTNVVSA